jgi:hypothetical protein
MIISCVYSLDKAGRYQQSERLECLGPQPKPLWCMYVHMSTYEQQTRVLRATTSSHLPS